MKWLWILVALVACDAQRAAPGLDMAVALDARADGPAPDPDRLAPDGRVPDSSSDAPMPDLAVDAAPPAPGARLRLPYAGAERDRVQLLPVFGFDHDPEDRTRSECLDHQGRAFPYCYDGHTGTDFLLRGGFAAMDRADTQVVAAASGRVVAREDGRYDRCHAGDGGQVTCDGHPIEPNFVVLEHANGWQTRYLHLRQGSVPVQVGDHVRCGDRIGYVGSSGNSSLPHIHLAVYDPSGRVLDPYAGPQSQPWSLWVTQDAGDGLPGDRCDPAW